MRSVAHTAAHAIFWLAILLVCSEDSTATGSSLPALKIGTPLTLSGEGEHAAVGRALHNAYTLFFDWVNEVRGGLQLSGGTMVAVEFITLDDQASKEHAERATEHMLGVMDVELFLGPSSSELTEAVAALVQAAGKVQVAPAAAAPQVFEDRPGVFGTLAPAGQNLEEALRVVSVADAGTRKTLAYLSEDVGGPLASCAAVPRLAEQGGAFELLAEQMVLPSDASEASLVHAVSQLSLMQPEVVVACADRLKCRLLLKEMMRQRFSPKALVVSGCGGGDASFVQGLGMAADFAISTAPWLPTLPLEGPITGSWTAKTFAREYERRFGTVPSYEAASAFAAAGTLAYAVEASGSASPAAVASRLRTVDSASIFGRVAFDENGQRLGSPQVVQYQRGGRPALVSSQLESEEEASTEREEAQLVYPKPDWATMDCSNLDPGYPSRYGLLQGQCSKCPAGRASKIQSRPGRRLLRLCVACAPGWVGQAARTGQQACEPCPAGTSSSREGSTSCSLCAVGSFGNLSGQTSCQSCPPGHVSKDEGSVACLECNGGFYQSSGGRSFCRPCEVGTFSDHRAAVACTSCPASLRTAGRGFAKLSDCGCPSGEQLIAPEKGSSPDGDDAPRCRPCPVDMHCPGFGAAVKLLPGPMGLVDGSAGAYSGVWV